MSDNRWGDDFREMGVEIVEVPHGLKRELSKARWGLKLVRIGAVSLVAALPFALAAGVTAAAMGGDPSHPAVLPPAALMLLLALAAVGFTLAGYVNCQKVHSDTGAIKYTRFAWLLLGGAVCLGIVAGVVRESGIRTLAQLVSMLSYLFFLAYLWRINKYVGRDDLAESVKITGFIYGVAFMVKVAELGSVVFVMLSTGRFNLPVSAAPFLIIASLVNGILSVIVIWRHIVLLNKMIAAFKVDE